MFGSFRPPMVGLDIGSSAVKAVVLRRGRGGWSLVAAGEAPVPDGSIQDGAAAEPTVVSEAVSNLLDSMRLKRARVTAALSGHAVIVKRLSLPPMSQAELNEAIPWEAEQYIPFDLSEVQLDYQVVGNDDATKRSLDVLLVAAKRDRIDDRAAVITQSGRKPVVLDIEAFALANAYRMNYPERTDALSVLVHVGRSVTIVCLLEAGELVFTRDISIGGQIHLDALLRELGPGGLDELTARRILHGQIPGDLSGEQVEAVLREASAQLVLEVRKTVDFYRATAPIEKISRVVLSGGAYQAVGLIELLAGEFDAPVDVFDPFRRVNRSAKAVGADVSGPAYAVAVGLAMRQEDDR
ncbi:MAG: type IV pilus assembly protein PilM [Acidobacteriota bacterium]|jgi:type IV pilus assembly protein PilM|nr:MAG: pilus assembly protein PilM [Acidobacteriota bacterium]